MAVSRLRRSVWPAVTRYRALRDREPILDCGYEGMTAFYPARSEIGQTLAAGRGWDRVLRAILRELVGDRAALVVDVGANVGASLIEMKLGAPRARFLCLEPSRRFASCLRQTVAANGWTDVQVLEVAAGAAEERRTLYVNATTASVVAAAYGERRPLGAQHVAVTTLDRLLGGEHPCFVKVDTDGFELDVLLGARETLERDGPPLFLELDPGLLAWGGRDEDALLALLDDLHYRRFTVYEPGGSEPARKGGPDVLAAAHEGPLHVNVLALAS